MDWGGGEEGGEAVRRYAALEPSRAMFGKEPGNDGGIHTVLPVDRKSQRLDVRAGSKKK